jgi:hypothetical protein
MRIISIALLVFLALQILSCNKREITTIPHSPPILEVTRNSRGLWDVTGELLYFRLFDDGTVEFDLLNFDKKVPGKNSYKTSELKERKVIKISAEEVGEIDQLLSREELGKLNNEYRPKRSCIDAFHNDSISINNNGFVKDIKISSHCENLASPNKDNFPDLPESISVLFKRIDAIKSKTPIGSARN